MNFDVADVAVHEADHVLRIIERRIPGGRKRTLRVVPRVRKQRGNFRDQDGSARVFYRTDLPTGKAGTECAQHRVRRSGIERVARIISKRLLMKASGHISLAVESSIEIKSVGGTSKELVLRR